MTADWPKRPIKRDHALLGVIRIWKHRTNEEFPLVETGYYAAIRRTRDDGTRWWDMISRHRKLSAAKKACEVALSQSQEHGGSIASSIT
jgi:hypothetical protein